MKLEYCEIEYPIKEGNESRIVLVFSAPENMTGSLVAEVGRRIENFLAPTPPMIVAGPVLAEYLRATPAAEEEEETKPTTRTRTRAVKPVEVTITHEVSAAPIAAEVTPAIRRTRAPAPVAAPEITDMDLAKAASGAAEILGTQIVKDIIAEMGVKTVNEIEGFEKRQYFLKLLDMEKNLVAEEKANG